MGFSNGTPTISTDGLVFAVDAGNGQSYVSGSLDTFNLVSSDTGSIHNDVDFSSANQGSWAFDGADDNINFGTSIGTKLGDSVTTISVSLWFKCNDPNSNDGIFSIGDFSSSVGVFTISTYLDAIYMRLNNTGFSQNEAFTDTTNWHHLVSIYDGSNGIMYLDNSEVINEAASITLDFDGKITGIGTYYTVGGYSFNGNIANCKIYNRVLTSAEVTKDYNATKGRFI